MSGVMLIFIGGFGLWVDAEGRLHHTYSFLGVETYKQVSREKLPTGDVSVKMLFEADEPKPGAGGKVTVFFVTPKFVATKRLPEHYTDTVLQIVLQHEHATDTPESMNLVTNKAFKHEAKGGVDKYTDEKEGLIYTFVESHLKTTRYSYSMDRLTRIQRGK